MVIASPVINLIKDGEKGLRKICCMYVYCLMYVTDNVIIVLIITFKMKEAANISLIESVCRYQCNDTLQ